VSPVLYIHPGYLGNESLLNEYRLLRAATTTEFRETEPEKELSIIRQWRDHSSAAGIRFQWLAAELDFRGVTRKLPEMQMQGLRKPHRWPQSIARPALQLDAISENRDDIKTARIAFPKNAQQAWAQHKYSIMARDNELYRELGPRVAATKTESGFADVMDDLTYALRIIPGEGGIRNAAQHMWGHVSDNKKVDPDFGDWTLTRLLSEIKRRAVNQKEKYLLHSTALTELQTWLPGK